MAAEETRRDHRHGHMGLVGVIGVAAGLFLMVYVPSLPAISGAVLLFGGFHLVGAVVFLGSLYVMAGDRLARRLRMRTKGEARDFDFGWALAWTYGPWIAALFLIATAIAIEAAAPGAWPVALLATLLAASFFAGGLIARTTGRYDHAVLPMVDLWPNEAGQALDAGCGAGRTTLALGRAYKKGRIIALDLFDSTYIAGGGRALIEENVRRAGMSARVAIEKGDLTALPFADNAFDAAISAHAVDHLGPHSGRALQEIRRVLKPGGRFLLIVWVPGWTMFAIANLLAFALKPKRGWRRMAAEAGFALRDEGVFNGYWFALLEKRAAAVETHLVGPD
jgi:SAM-dependent methyltransferase